MPKRMLPLLLMLASGAWPRGATVSEVSVDLFIMAGQSNMQGYMGNAALYPGDATGVDADIPFFYLEPADKTSHVTGTGFVGRPPAATSEPPKDLHDARAWLGALFRFARNRITWPPRPSPAADWTWLGPQWGRFPDGHFGPEVSFARQLHGAGYSPAIFKYSKASTSLADDWKGPGEGGLYDHFTATLGAAIVDLRKRGYRVNIRGLIWIQGENDALHDRGAVQYHDRLRGLIRHMRSHFLPPAAPIMLGADEDHPLMRQRPAIETAQAALARSEPCVRRSSMRNLAKADFTHLTPQAVVEHGTRLYRDYATALAECAHQPPRSFPPPAAAAR